MHTDVTIRLGAGDVEAVRVEMTLAGDDDLVVLDDTGEAVIVGPAEILFAWLAAAAVQADRLATAVRATPEQCVAGLSAAREALAVATLRRAGDPHPDVTVSLVGPAEAMRQASTFTTGHAAHVEAFLGRLA